MRKSMLEGSLVATVGALTLFVACGGETTYSHEGFGASDSGTGGSQGGGDGTGGSASDGGSNGAGGGTVAAGGMIGAGGTYVGSGGYFGAGGAFAGGRAGMGGAIPITCGNGVIDPGETCDFAVPAGMSCASVTAGSRPSGTLLCSPYCQIDTSRCTGGTATDGGPPSSYTCLANGGNPDLMFGAISSECGSFSGGPLMGICAEVISGSEFATFIPQDICPAGMLCVPFTKFEDPKSCFAPCQSPFGDAACVPTYVVEATAQGMGLSSVLGQVTCANGETCTPCVSPLDATVTRACSY